MPELPEARTIARRLDQAVAGAGIAGIDLRRREMLKTGTPAALRRLAGQAIRRVDTRGKYVVVHTDRRRLVIQLGMAGRVRLAAGGDPLEPHTHLVVTLTDGRAVRYSNTRRIASGLHLLPAGGSDLGPLAALGPEATEITFEQFCAAMTGTRRPIKAALLDQARLAGLGNIYTDEALARCGIRPTRRADRLSRRRLQALHRACRVVLAEAIAAGGSTLADANPYVDADGHVGYFAVAHRVYGRSGKPCLTCGAVLRRTLVAGRTSVYCPRCQR